MAKFGLIGKTLNHSFSKTFFTELFAKKELAHSYENIELETIEEIVPLLKSNTYSGFNVTIPYKESVIPFLDEIDFEAKQIGAVNTVVFENGKWIGYNTDAFGFRQSIKPFLDFRHQRAIILGTGGASKAVSYVLKSIGLDIIFISRNPKGENQFHYSDINFNMLNACKLIVNCTPLGTFPALDDKPAIPTELLNQDNFVVDLIYNPEKSKLLQEAEAQGTMILNGYSMLKEQALKAWDLWQKTL